jgi:dinuclear metal center YbgI/SA1388 family protein
MSVSRDELDKYLSEFLKTTEFNDYCPNGLQFEGRPEITKIVTGVSASVDLFKKAAEKKADAVITHHGLIWNFERPIYRGGYKKRVKLLIDNEISLFGFHLPLDANEKVGNNAVIAKTLGLKNIVPFGDYKGQYIGMRGEIGNMNADEFFEIIRSKINEDLIVFAFGPDTIKTAGIISGGAQKEVQQAVLEGLDVYITGEVSEYTLHYVKEEGIHFVAAGHHATERFGIQALGRHIQDKFDVDVEYVEIPNPI